MRHHPGQRREDKNVAAAAEHTRCSRWPSQPGQDARQNGCEPPNTITAIASRLRDSNTAIATTASTIVSLIRLTGAVAISVEI
jgi:hypothetical protein